MIALLLAAASFFSFQTPSHNIACVGDAHYIRCDTRYATKYSQPKYKPRGCDLDWGPLSMGPRGKAGVICAGDTALDPASTVLAYGERTRQGSIVCESAQAGVTCTNEASGHGFFLSRESWHTF